MEKVRILLVRHGQSEGNIDDSVYIKKGDSNIELTETGWKQLIRTGKFLSNYYVSENVTDWPMIHFSTHQRTQQSLSGILHGMDGVFEGNPKIHAQSLLVEKFFGAASALAFLEDVPKEFREFISLLAKSVYKNDPFIAKHMFGESTKDTLISALHAMATIRRDIAEGKNEFLIVCHGAVIQVILMGWMHALPKDKNKIGNPGNGDVIEISGSSKNWNFKRIWDGEEGKRVDENYRDRVKRFTVEDLPPVPDFLKAAP